jgi:sugar phosphate isomerase/epimerase
VQITLDIGHVYMAAQFYSFDPVEAVSSIKDLIAHTHVHDNFGGAIYYNEKIQTHQIPLGRGDAHMPVGWGEIPIALILSAYLRSHSGLMILELRNRYFNHLQKSKANLVQLLNSLTSESPLRSGVSLGPSAAG